MESPDLIFITGTDTGVGKTLVTALLLCHLRAQGTRALAIKPFCSGARTDAEILNAVQDHALDLDDVNPFYFSESLAPFVAARKHRRTIALNDVLGHLRGIRSRCDCLLIEGAGGLLAPFGPGYTLADLVLMSSRRSSRLCGSKVIVVARNALGTLNHTLLTVSALQSVGIQQIAVVLMGQKTPDESANSNPRILQELLQPIPVLEIPFLGSRACKPHLIRAAAKKLKKTLARILAWARVCVPLFVSRNR